MILNKKTISLIIVFHISIIGSVYAKYRDIKFEHLTIEDGLSNTFVGCMLQDSRGFLWFGTQDGLNRYDGYEFKIFRNIPGDSSSLSSNDIWEIFEDRSGQLWIGTSGGLNIFDNEKECFNSHFYQSENPRGINSVGVRTLCQDRYGDLWVGTEAGLNRFDNRTKQYTSYMYDPLQANSLCNCSVWSICEDREGILWVGTSNGLYRYDREDDRFIHYDPDSINHRSMDSNAVTCVYEDRAGVLWIGMVDGVYKFDRKDQIFIKCLNPSEKSTSPSREFISAICEDRSGILWIGSINGLKRYDVEKADVTYYKHNPNNPYSLSDNSIYAIVEDNSGILWFSGSGGVDKYDKNKEKFKHFKRDPNNLGGLSSNSIRAICMDHLGILWISTTESGLNRFDRERDIYKNYKHDPNDSHSLISNKIRGILTDRSGVLWIVTKGGLNTFDRENEQFIRYRCDPGDPTTISSDGVRSVCEDQNGVIWVGTDNGLNKFDRVTEQFTRYPEDPKDPDNTSGYIAESMYVDKSGKLWFSSNGNLIRFDTEKEQFKNYKQDYKNFDTKGNPVILCIYEDQKAILWLGTASGLIKFDRKGQIFEHYNVKDGLPNDVIYGILEDDHGNLWLSTNNGIAKFNPEAESFKNYNTDDGLQSREFNGGAYLKSKDGEMFFGGINGFNAFYPDSIKDDPFIPPIVITDFQLFNKSIKPGPDSPLQQSISGIRELTLAHAQSIFSFEFAALDYGNPEKIIYAYKMEGVDPDWVFTDASRRFATYTQLNPGKYKFRVKAANHDGLWNEDGTSLIITITPPWWKTTWAYVLYIMAISGLVVGIVLFNHRRLAVRHELKMKSFEAEKLKELDQMKSKFFANISHEFRTPLTLIEGPVNQLLSGKFRGNLKEQYGMILRNTNRLKQLITQLLDLSKFENGRFAVKPESVDAIALVKRITMSFLSLAEFHNIDLKFTAKDKSIRAYLDIDIVKKIVTNLLSNAIKFTKEGGKVDVSIAKIDHAPESLSKKSNNGDGFVQITIADSGIGIPPGYLKKIFERFYQIDDSFTRKFEGTGLGLALTKEMVELHEGEITVDSHPNRGTIFKIYLPIISSYSRKRETTSREVVTGTDDTLEEKSEDYSTAHHSLEDEKIDIEIANDERKSVHDRSSKPLILIIEDNKDVRSFINNFLAGEYQVVEASDGVEGGAIAINIIPDLIISDVMMPQMDGMELCRKLKADERTSHIPIILLTARASMDDKLEGLEIGADDYIIKPFDSEEIKSRVGNLIDQRKKLREKFGLEVLKHSNDTNAMSMDDKFLTRAVKIIDQHISNPDFSVRMFGKELGMSRTQLHRKIKALTNHSPHMFIRLMRLNRAAFSLSKDTGNVSDVAYEVGFTNLSHFSKTFKEHFGYTPSEYRRKSMK